MKYMYRYMYIFKYINQTYIPLGKYNMPLDWETVTVLGINMPQSMDCVQLLIKYM